MIRICLFTLIIFISIIVVLSVMFLEGNIRMYLPPPNFSLDKIPNQQGKIIIITGGTSGVGRASAEQLCARDAKLVIITGTSQASAEKAANEIKNNYCSASPTKMIGRELKLEDHVSIKNFADWFRSLNEPLHILMLNAGLASVKFGKTSVGLELTVGINWFGHFYLQQLLQDIVERSTPSRIIIISSMAQADVTKFDKSLESVTMADKMPSSSFDLYGISKFFNLLHAVELNRRIRAKGINNIYVLTVNPGMVWTNFVPRMAGSKNGEVETSALLESFSKEKYNVDPFLFKFFNTVARKLALTPIDGALSQLYAATSPEIVEKGYSGGFIAPIARYVGLDGDLFATVTPLAKNEKLARELWAYGESLISQIEKSSRT